MPSLRLVTLFILLFFITSCSNFKSFSQDGGQSPPSSPNSADIASTISNPYPFDSPFSIIDRNRNRILAVVLLLLLLLLQRLHVFNMRHKKQVPLDKEEVALLGLATDTINDLWRHLQTKTRRNIIPFTREN